MFGTAHAAKGQPDRVAGKVASGTAEFPPPAYDFSRGETGFPSGLKWAGSSKTDNPEVRNSMTAETLNGKSVKDLGQLAKRRGIQGWHTMRKEELVKALLRLARAKTNGHRPVAKRRNPQVVRRLAAAKAKLAKYKNLAHSGGDATASEKDRLVVMVRGPHWLHA